jgi:paraquat-inducible protein B
MSAAETYKADASQMGTLVTGFGDAMEKFARSATEITSNQVAFTQSLKDTQATITSLSGTLGSIDKTLAELKSSFAAHNTSFTRLVADSTSSMSGAFQKHLDETRKEMEKLMGENSVQLQSFSDMMLDIHLDGRAAHATGGRK